MALVRSQLLEVRCHHQNWVLNWEISRWRKFEVWTECSHSHDTRSNFQNDFNAPCFSAACPHHLSDSMKLRSCSFYSRRLIFIMTAVFCWLWSYHQNYHLLLRSFITIQNSLLPHLLITYIFKLWVICPEINYLIWKANSFLNFCRRLMKGVSFQRAKLLFFVQSFFLVSMIL